MQASNSTLLVYTLENELSLKPFPSNPTSSVLHIVVQCLNLQCLDGPQPSPIWEGIDCCTVCSISLTHSSYHDWNCLTRICTYWVARSYLHCKAVSCWMSISGGNDTFPDTILLIPSNVIPPTGYCWVIVEWCCSNILLMVLHCVFSPPPWPPV